MLDQKQTPQCLSDLMFDAWFGGEIEAATGQQLEAHVADCTRCAQRHELLHAERAAFLEREQSWETFHARHANGVSTRASRRALWAYGAALAACACLAIIAQRAPVAVRSKGGARIGAYVKHGEHVVAAIDGDTVEAGDFLRFTYSSDVPVYFALLNWDARSAAKYYPAGDLTVRLPAGRDVALDFSVELDDAPGTERVHGLFCDRPQRLEPVRAMLQAGGGLSALPHCRIDVLTLQKRKARQ
jgi:hypothetical protein